MAPPVVNDSKNRGGADQTSYEELKRLAFVIDRAVGYFVVFSSPQFLFSEDFLRRNNVQIQETWFLLSPAICFFIISNFIYISSYINAKVASDNQSHGRAELIKDVDVVFWMERLAAFFVFMSLLPSHEVFQGHLWLFAVSLIVISNVIYTLCYIFPEVKIAKDEKNIIDKKNTEQHQETELDNSLKGLKEEVNEKDERIKTVDEENSAQQNLGLRVKEAKQEEKTQDKRNNTDEETTKQHRAKLEVRVKELKKEVRSIEGKCLAKMEKKVELLEKNFEEQKSQLMYHLGATRAWVQIYRKLLHDLHYHQP